MGSRRTPRNTVTTRRRALGLRTRLILSDAAGLGIAGLLAWLVAGGAPEGAPSWHGVVFVAGCIALGLVFARWQRLFQTSRSSIRFAELTAIVRVAALLGVSSLLVGELAGTGPDVARGAVLTVLTTATYGFSRSLFRAWLRARRERGDFVRPVALIGVNRDAARIVNVLHDHPDSGFRVVGIYGDSDASLRAGLRQLWRGDVHDAVGLVRTGQVTGAVIVATALDSDTLNEVVREVIGAGGHVHLSSGLHGLASQRILSEPIAHEPLLHIHPTELGPHQVITKRIVDVVLSGALLVLAAPVLLVAVALIRLTDRGPALFRQVRVGHDDRPFNLLKLRTMVVDAEDRLYELGGANLRNGPLFKVDDDPRVTAVGRFLRATSIDELPQLWNVLRGEMSLVGPRPALPSEVEQFPAELSKRTNVPPGVTGLWQVEARDNPSFDAYARLDLFYVDNWTLTFDLVIMLATVESEVARFLGALFQRRQRDADDNGVVGVSPTEARFEAEPHLGDVEEPPVDSPLAERSVNELRSTSID